MLSFLVLQGNATPFFSELAAALKAAGHHVRRIAFNGGDVVFSSDATWFRGREEALPAFIEDIVARERPDAMILFGDCRPIHRVATEIARERGIAIWVFEEGYLRPGWITLEPHGVNGFSALPRDAAAIRARGTAPWPAPRYKPHADFLRRSVYDVSYHALRVALTPLFPHARFHAAIDPFVEYAGWLRDWAGRLVRKPPQAVLPDGPFMLVPMQMEGDYQLRVHSPFHGMGQALEQILGSFAAHAPDTLSLVVRRHPLDPRLTDWEGLVRDRAQALGVADRVYFMSEGPLEPVLDSCIGVVTVNSTVGLLALRRNKPVKILGEAIYDVEGLTFSGPLGRYWREACAPDAGLLDAFCRMLIQEVLVEGDFFTPEGRALAVEGSVRRILSAYSDRACNSRTRTAAVVSI
ncbi:Capsule polysaccharide biosynthesis protein [Gluconacetobacter diazotrophicus PA1 5]|uniref:capsule biosynthesis protein n=1 Tax=Gluconacetobacter diazotrophicus TaxID=33996 RepID=UPI000173B26C|nr:capsular biosynthesis protein [Gluconacetobacter diazotrophicus]ACI50434.1 Capsule polysaccharide biosynthesis protein [Gluconacetobacter diazotrophicus PA1 5]TWB08271.1 capsular polysaccharide export protein [Gluconacetobacter diazotrophicus]